MKARIPDMEHEGIPVEGDGKRKRRYTNHQYIAKICDMVALGSTCEKKDVGAVFVTDNYEILATGHNGAPRGFPHCDDSGHWFEHGHCVRNVHAEPNAIIQAAKTGVSLKDSILYVNWVPCRPCAFMLINLGIKEIRIKETRIHKATEILERSKIKVTYWKDMELE